MKKKWLFLTGTTALALLTACSQESNTVAKTSYGNVTKDQLYQTMRQSAGAQALYTRLIQVVAEGNVQDKEAVNKEVAAYIEARKSSAGSEAQFLTVLKQNGFDSEAQFKEAIYSNFAITQVIKEKTVITDEEIAQAYETWTPSVTASHILVSDEETAKSIIQQLNDGADWNTLAAQHSIDTANKNKGGSLGTFKPSSMVSEFAEGIQSLKDGEITQTPIKTTFGYHVVKMESNPSKTDLETDKEAVKKDLLETKAADQSNQKAIIDELLKNANVQIEDVYLNNSLKSILPSTGEESSTTSSSN